MSLHEPGIPYFDKFGSNPRSDKPFPGAKLTTAGIYRVFEISKNSPHEPWCMHFEWGPCNCGPRPGEKFVEKGFGKQLRRKNINIDMVVVACLLPTIILDILFTWGMSRYGWLPAIMTAFLFPCIVYVFILLEDYVLKITLGNHMTDTNWPTFCEIPECTDPSLRPHHHHCELLPGVPNPDACTCGDIEEPGTRPKEE